jgi:hypothetical protein
MDGESDQMKQRFETLWNHGAHDFWLCGGAWFRVVEEPLSGDPPVRRRWVEGRLIWDTWESDQGLTATSWSQWLQAWRTAVVPRHSPHHWVLEFPKLLNVDEVIWGLSPLFAQRIWATVHLLNPPEKLPLSADWWGSEVHRASELESVLLKIGLLKDSEPEGRFAERCYQLLTSRVASMATSSAKSEPPTDTLQWQSNFQMQLKEESFCHAWIEALQQLLPAHTRS